MCPTRLSPPKRPLNASRSLCRRIQKSISIRDDYRYAYTCSDPYVPDYWKHSKQVREQIAEPHLFHLEPPPPSDSESDDGNECSALGGLHYLLGTIQINPV